MNRIVKVSGVEVVLGGYPAYRSADKDWYEFVPNFIYGTHGSSDSC